MSVDINLLKQLREATFAPLKDCKEALVESWWDLEKAKAFLKEKWILKAWKKADRETNEGLVKLVNENWKIIWLKLLCETDFVAKNEWFMALLDKLLNDLSSQTSLFDSKDSAPWDLIESFNSTIQEAVWSIWENIQLWDAFITDKNWFVYNHPWNKVASVVFYDSGDDEIAKEIALQVAAMNPSYLDYDSVPKDSIIEIEEKFRQELIDSWKPENMIDQILKWKIQKALADDVLLEQDYIRDGSKKLKDIIPDWFKINSYIRLSVK